MPKFPKNKDYKMKGSEFYQSGNSPAKQVGDKQLVKGQKDLNDIELKHRQPGWAKVASAIANTKLVKGLDGKLVESMGGNAKKDAAAGPQGKDFKIEENPKIGPEGDEGKIQNPFHKN